MNYIIINEHGDYFFENTESPIKSLEIKQELVKNMSLTDSFMLKTTFTNSENVDEEFIIECFDHPLFIQNISINEKSEVIVQTHTHQKFIADINKFSLDYKDRICGITTHKVPFVLTDKAQENLFDECDEFDDDSFTLNQIQIATPSYFISNEAIQNSSYWSQVYKNETNPGWNLGEAATTLKDMLPRLKLPKCRVLVLGCGEGHDAALFAQAGHVVTAVDFCKESIEQAKKHYSNLKIDFIQDNIFNLPHEWNNSFDVIVEHTCFCAIMPEQRTQMAKLWRRLLHEEGQLLATFYTMLKRSGPPFGTTELEVRDLLQKDFQFLFWSRWRKSLDKRLGRELLVLAKKRG